MGGCRGGVVGLGVVVAKSHKLIRTSINFTKFVYKFIEFSKLK